MGTQTDYFNNLPRYKPKWEYGARVFGHWNKIPFIGMVVADRAKNHILIHSDLPIVIDKKLHYVIIVEHKDITVLKEF